jgi:aminobenzoyl-glutamate utilization protein B
MKRNGSFLAFLALALALPFDASAGPKETALAWLAEQHDYLRDVSETLWAMPEPAHAEHRTSTYIQNELERAGFEIESGVASLPTAFVASYGSGPPVIGIVALLDALPGLSKEKLVTERRPTSPGGAGHGCGHNLIGAADLGAVLAVKQAIDDHSLPGTVRFFGAPAEEIYHGGVYMARDGVFDDVDALLFWHPSAVTTVITRSGLAMDSIRFVFHGLASDATDAAAKGINALAAAYQLSTAAEREKALWPEDAVLNHVLVEGGTIPSIVPERAVLWFFLHARDRGGAHLARASPRAGGRDRAKNEDARRDADLIVDPSLAHQQEHRRATA